MAVNYMLFWWISRSYKNPRKHNCTYTDTTEESPMDWPSLHITRTGTHPFEEDEEEEIELEVAVCCSVTVAVSYLNIWKYQLLLDSRPYNTCHLITIHLDHGILGYDTLCCVWKMALTGILSSGLCGHMTQHRLVVALHPLHTGDNKATSRF